ncbi:MAG: hypothetical protein ACI857_000160 [Arenicella sp.]|jgi:hypothetical protein
MSEEEGGGTFIDASQAKPEPVQIEPSKEKKKGGAYIIIILMLLVAGGFLGWKLSEKNDQINDCQNLTAEQELELAELNEMLYDTGLEMGDDLKDNLSNMLSMYDKMEIDNGDMNDSIQAQKDKISQMMLELDDAKGDRAYYASKVRKLQEETDVLRDIMKDYIRTIDSLNYANGILTESLATTLSDLETTNNNLTDVTQERNDFADKVSKGSKLVASSILSTGIKEKGSGSFKETDKASRATDVRSCFVVGENAIATPGNKTIYMRVITPSGTVMNSGQSNSFTSESGAQMIYSDKKTINYQNQPTDVCIFYKMQEVAGKGNYIAEIWCEGAKIGTDKFVLK